MATWCIGDFGEKRGYEKDLFGDNILKYFASIFIYTAVLDINDTMSEMQKRGQTIKCVFQSSGQ